MISLSQEHCYIQDLEDFLSKVGIVSKLDLTQGFHQIWVPSNDHSFSLQASLFENVGRLQDAHPGDE